MMHLHSMGMMHRDLKIDNVMLNYVFEAKIFDFDLVHIRETDEENSLTKGIGTLDYMSPEMINNENYSNKTDVYSYGIFLFTLFTGNLPKQSMKEKLNKKAIELPRPSTAISEVCISLIEKCTKFSPNERSSFVEIIDEIESKSFYLAKGVDFKIIENRFLVLKNIQTKFIQNLQMLTKEKKS